MRATAENLSFTGPATDTRPCPVSLARAEAWRLGSGGTPELLVTAGPGSTAVSIPANLTFTPGGLYQLWLVALNSKGRSAPGPVQNWTASLSWRDDCVVPAGRGSNGEAGGDLVYGLAPPEARSASAT